MMQIAIDGPASSGKSTVAKEIAQQLNITYIDTGAMYRAVTLAALEAGVNLSHEEEVSRLLNNISLSFKETADEERAIFLNDENVSKKIRSTEVTEHVSLISSYPQVRDALVKMQQRIAQEQSVIMDGRDIGTIVLPDADFKFYLIADSRVRAERRHKQNLTNGIDDQTVDEIEAAIIRRDQYDTSRKHSPLKKADDAIEINTSHHTVDETANRILSHIKSKK